jgi:hypothetical protein
MTIAGKPSGREMSRQWKSWVVHRHAYRAAHFRQAVEISYKTQAAIPSADFIRTDGTVKSIYIITELAVGGDRSTGALPVFAAISVINGRLPMKPTL